jgi:hypothetical protein
MITPDHTKITINGQEPTKEEKYRVRHLRNSILFYYRHREKILAYKKIWGKNNLDKQRERNNKYYTTHKSKSHTRTTTGRKAIKKNECEFCGSKINLEFHHIDYNNPLEIKTLCRNCHRKLHRKVKMINV